MRLPWRWSCRSLRDAPRSPCRSFQAHEDEGLFERSADSPAAPRSRPAPPRTAPPRRFEYFASESTSPFVAPPTSFTRSARRAETPRRWSSAPSAATWWRDTSTTGAGSRTWSARTRPSARPRAVASSRSLMPEPATGSLLLAGPPRHRPVGTPTRTPVDAHRTGRERSCGLPVSKCRRIGAPTGVFGGAGERRSSAPRDPSGSNPPGGRRPSGRSASRRCPCRGSSRSGRRWRRCPCIRRTFRRPRRGGR